MRKIFLIVSFCVALAASLGFAGCGPTHATRPQTPAPEPGAGAAADPGNGGQKKVQEPPGLPPSRVGLSQAALEDVADPIGFTYSKDEDSKSATFSPYSPPTIPHEIGDYIPITRDANECIGCHQTEKRTAASDPVPLPQSHYVNPRTGARTKTVASVRYNCTACHVPSSDAKPLVGNSFENFK